MIRTILALVKKEFLQVLRDRNMLRMIFIMPIFQLLLLGYVARTLSSYPRQFMTMTEASCPANTFARFLPANTSSRMLPAFHC